MELEAPGFDIVGFERAADVARDRAAIEDAVAQLARRANLFTFSDGAGCRRPLPDAQHSGLV